MDYTKLGFKCGIEVHQQLEGKKLFCGCSTTNIRDTKPDIIFERRLRAVAGETGEIDAAAQYEMKKSKRLIYEADSRDVCLVEADEEPPHSINKEAVFVAVQLSLILNAKIVDEIQVMRKTVVDGSNVSGFQRTALVGYNGKIETSKGPVGISGIFIEEEAAQKIEETKEHIRYRLDRLGIPLIEIATDSSIKDNFHAKEVAEKLGMILRSTGKVKRGIGSIRQDVNLSINNKERVEIKGFQEIKIMPTVIEKEVARQLKLNKKEENHVRMFKPDGTTVFLRPMPGAARMYPESDCIPLRITKEELERIELPELISDKLEKLEKKYNIGKEKIKSLMKDNKLILFEEIAQKNKNVKPSFVCETLLSYKSEIIKKHKNADISKIKTKDFKKIFEMLNLGKITKDATASTATDISLGKGLDFKKYELEEIDLETEITKIVKEKPGLNKGAYMGVIMGKFKGKVDGKKVMEVLNGIVK